MKWVRGFALGWLVCCAAALIGLVVHIVTTDPAARHLFAMLIGIWCLFAITLAAVIVVSSTATR